MVNGARIERSFLEANIAEARAAGDWKQGRFQRRIRSHALHRVRCDDRERRCWLPIHTRLGLRPLLWRLRVGVALDRMRQRSGMTPERRLPQRYEVTYDRAKRRARTLLSRVPRVRGKVVSRTALRLASS